MNQASSSGSGRPRDQASSSGSGRPRDHTSGGGDRAPGGDASRAVFQVDGSDVTHDGVMVTIRVDRVAMPDGSVAAREVAQRPDAVAVVPLTDDGQVVMVRQYRHPVGGYELEIPAGLLDVDGEPEDRAAQRELAEETGMQAGRLRQLTRFWNSAGWSDEATTVFLGTQLRPATPDDGFVAKAEEADMEVLRLPLHDALDRVRDGRITDAKTVIGLLLAEGEGEGERSEPVGGDRRGEGSAPTP